MTTFKGPLKVAILGVRGIGRVHARIFHSMGVDICAILGSSQKTAMEAARSLQESFGISSQPFSCFETLLKKAKSNVVCICTPPELHFNQIILCFNNNIPVFCEKPFFWHKEITPTEVEGKLSQIENHPNRRLFLNTSNAYFADRVITEINFKEFTNSFYFRFYTLGMHLGRDIAFDLLPHAFSLLLSVVGFREIQDINETIEDHSYKCLFKYGDCKVEFDFQENPNGRKELAFGINERIFTRIQEGQGATYRVFMEDSLSKEKIEVKDPFQAYIHKFISYCENGAVPGKDEFHEARDNLVLMTKILLKE